MIRNSPEQPRHVRQTFTFAGEATTGSPFTMFTVTGRVRITHITAYCTTLLGVTATPSVSLGIAGDTDAFIVSTLASDIDANEWWGAATPNSGSHNPASSITGGLVTSQLNKWVSSDVILTMTGAGGSVDSGVIVIDIWYYPITDNGALAAA